LLIRYTDGELPAGSLERIGAHLERCSRCRLEQHRLKSRLAAAAGTVGMDPCSEPGKTLLDRVITATRGWDAARSAAPASESVKRQAAGKLSPLLGPRATRRILETVPENGDGLLPAVEPVLALFLGRRAAEEISGGIAKEVIVRIW